MALILILAHAAVLLAPMQLVAPVGPGTDAVQSDRVKILKVSDQLPQELEWYASLGYCIVEVRGDVFRLERVSDSVDHGEYLVLPWNEEPRIEALMNYAASFGFRFVPRAVYNNFRSTEVVMERSAAAVSSPRLRYRIVSGGWVGLYLRTIEKEIIKAGKEGYRLVGITETTDETSDDPETARVAVLEKRDALDQDVTATPPPLELELMWLGAAPKRLQTLTALGFRIVFAQNPFLLLERKPGTDAQPEYAVIAERTRADLERAMNGAVQRGFRLIPGTFLTFRGLWTGVTTWTVIMERIDAPGPEPEYIVAETEEEKELSNLGARGYTYLEGRIFMRLPQRGTGR